MKTSSDRDRILNALAFINAQPVLNRRIRLFNQDNLACIIGVAPCVGDCNILRWWVQPCSDNLALDSEHRGLEHSDQSDLAVLKRSILIAFDA